MQKPLHAKDKGTLGEIAVAKDLMRRGLPVFKELGDNSRVDLIVLRNNVAIKIQVKSYKRSKNKDTVEVYGFKKGPNKYKYTYSLNDFSIMAVYLYEIDKIIYIPLKDILEYKSKRIVLRLKPPLKITKLKE